LAAIDVASPSRDAAIIDIGGGSSPLAGYLLDAGYRDITVLDVSDAALDLARTRLGTRGDLVTWISADLLSWVPPRRYAVWHDRAVLHFFIDGDDRRRYAETLTSSLDEDGVAVIATFAPGGPERCSGLPVQRSSANDIAQLLGGGFRMIDAQVRQHETPDGAVQPFTWVVIQRPAE
jgi:trans-aconitate methyltransferase